MNERDWKQLDDKSNLSLSSLKAGVNPARDVSTRTTRIKYKHSLAIRWMHWINFPLLLVMIYSGLLIYWADSQHEGLNATASIASGSVARHSFGSFLLRSTTTSILSSSLRKAWVITFSSYGSSH